MRDILCKGKRKDNDEWVEGYFVKRFDPITTTPKYYIFSQDVWYEVVPSSIGQFTEFTDKNDKKIFEGDYWTYPDEDDFFVVEFRDGQFYFVLYGIRGALMEYGWDETAGGFGECDCSPMTDYIIENIEIVGNIHDHPELLERS